LTRYRKTAPKPSIPEAPAVSIIVGKKDKDKTFLWMPDSKGNLVKKEASTVKKSFAKLSADAQIALTEYLIRVQNKVPTDAARRTLFNAIVDGAVASYKEGKKETPWQILGVMTQNAPDLANQQISYTQYDKITADALLNQIADSLGFNVDLITDDDRADFLKKINEQAQTGGKVVTRQVSGGGVETITTPAVFNAKEFAQNYLWTKVNLGDPTTIPTAVINQASGIQKLLKDNGLELSDLEVNQLGLDISRGTKSVEELQKDFAEMAARNYPQLADRLRATPGLTVRQAVSPIIGTIAKAWEVDPNTIDINDPMIDQLIRPDGIVGKQAPKTNYDAYLWAVNQPQYESTSDAISKAQQAALGLAKAMGWGV
jgi:hypothetical protein